VALTETTRDPDALVREIRRLLREARPVGPHLV
jgi:hypothetical protein